MRQKLSIYFHCHLLHAKFLCKIYISTHQRITFILGVIRDDIVLCLFFSLFQESLAWHAVQAQLRTILPVDLAFFPCGFTFKVSFSNELFSLIKESRIGNFDNGSLQSSGHTPHTLNPECTFFSCFVFECLRNVSVGKESNSYQRTLPYALRSSICVV